MKENRWLAVWRFLSLDRTRPYFPDLWLSFRDPGDFQNGVRHVLEPSLTPAKYFVDAGRVHLEISRWVAESFGPFALPTLRDWNTYIFLDGEGDGWTESMWASFAFH